MKVKVLEDCSYSADGFTVIYLCKGDTASLPADIEAKFIARGLVECATTKPFTPVEETAVLEPVKEVKKRRRKKKAE